MNVDWRPCYGLPDYEVSEYGLVRRRTKALTRKSGHYLRGFICGQGYHRHKLPTPTGKRIIPTHRLVLEAFVGPAPTSRHVVAHWDGDPLNNHYSNLRWATHAENGADKKRHGSHRGERNSTAKLTPTDVLAIRAQYPSVRKIRGGVSRLAEKYGVTPTTIYNAAIGIRWGHIHAE